MPEHRPPTIGLVGALTACSVALCLLLTGVASGPSGAGAPPVVHLQPALVEPPPLSSAVDADATLGVPWEGVVATFAPATADFDEAPIRDPIAWVEGVHPHLVGKPPTPHAVTSWAGQVERQLPRTVAAFRIARSRSGLRHHVGTFYEEYFGRQASASETGYWADQIRAGAGPRKVRALFLASDESWVRAGSTFEGFVDRVYRLALGRAPDQAGFDHWVTRLRRGEPRHAMTLHLLASDELRARVVGQLTSRVLGRPPTSSEQAAWVARFRQAGELHALAAIAGGRAFWTSLPDEWSAEVDWGVGTTVREPDVWRAARGPDGALHVRSGHAFTTEGPHDVAVTLLRSGEQVETLTAHFEVVDTPLARWVAAAFPDTVGHEPGPEAVRRWTVVARTEGRAAAARGLLLTGAGRLLLVDQVFQDHLDRSSTSQYWADQLAAGMPLEQLRAQLLGSKEFLRSAGGTPEGWVDAVFQELLLRPPRDDERADRLNRLAAGEGRASIARTLLSYPEAQGPLVDRLVQQYLDRSAGAGERSDLIQRLQSGLDEIGLRALLVAHHERFAVHERAGS